MYVGLMGHEVIALTDLLSWVALMAYLFLLLLLLAPLVSTMRCIIKSYFDVLVQALKLHGLQF